MKLSKVFAVGRDKLLEAGVIYSLLQWLVGSAKARRHFVSRFAVVKPGARILEIGCGPGTLVPFLGNEIGEYLGYDPNPNYIKAARRRFPDPRYRFLCGKTADAARDLAVMEGTFDLVISAAVLHHLDDKEAQDLIKLAAFACGSRGCFASYDNTFVENQHRVARLLIQADRGQFVRTPQEYQVLIAQAFKKTESDIRHDVMSIPYTVIFFHASNGPEISS